MYGVKAAGRGSYRFYKDSLPEHELPSPNPSC
jgi:hypothetical protein